MTDITSPSCASADDPFREHLIGRIVTKPARLLRNEAGGAAVEYSLVAGLIALATLTAMQLLGEELSALFTSVLDRISQALA